MEGMSKLLLLCVALPCDKSMESVATLPEYSGLHEATINSAETADDVLPTELSGREGVVDGTADGAKADTGARQTR